MIKDTDYAYSVAYMRTMEAKMLKQADVEALLQFGDLSDAVRFLEERGYQPPPEKEKDDDEEEPKVVELGKEEIDEMLGQTLEQVWEDIRSVMPEGAPIDILLYQNDFHNMKTILKAVFSKTGWQDLMIGPYTTEPELIYNAVSENAPEELPDFLQRAEKKAYEKLAERNDGQLAEIVLDKAAFEALKTIAEESESQFLIDWVEMITY
ncbi:MAG: V0D/AC39 family V-type ATPase subunit [Christensenellaceae bacterium]